MASLIEVANSLHEHGVDIYVREQGMEQRNMLIGIGGGAFDPEGFDRNAINRMLCFGPRRAAQIPHMSPRVSPPARG